MITTFEQLRSAVNAILDYNWTDEERDYEENGGPGHIFERMTELDAFFNPAEKEES